jgi:ketosteroid isomerase-like protein
MEPALLRDSESAVAEEIKVEIVRQALGAMADADLDALLRLFDPEIEYLPLTQAQVEGRGYRGHAGVREYFAEAGDLWHEMYPVADSFSTNGDDVVVVGRCEFRGKGSEIDTATPMAWVFTVRGGKILRYRGFPTPAAARAAAGLVQ